MEILLFDENEREKYCANNVLTNKEFFKKKCIVLFSVVFQNPYGGCQTRKTN